MLLQVSGETVGCLFLPGNYIAPGWGSKGDHLAAMYCMNGPRPLSKAAGRR